MKTYDVVTIGSAVKDIMFFTDAGTIKKVRDGQSLTLPFDLKVKSDTVHTGFGGGAANTAVNFVGMGLRTGTVLAVGDDDDGEQFKRFLRKKSISTSHVQVHADRHTGFSFLLIHEKNREHIAFTHYGATEELVVTKKELKEFQTDWWYVSSINNKNWQATMKIIAGQPGKLAWTPGGTQLEAGYRTMSPILKQTSALFLNRQEAIRLVKTHPSYKRTPEKAFAGMTGGKKLRDIIGSWGPEIVIVTSGRDAVFAQVGEEVYTEKPPKDKPVDTTGAGDSFASTFIAVYHKTSDIEKALTGAIVNTTSVVAKRGAQAGFMSWTKLRNYL